MLQNIILRDEWGFKGMVISDWGGTHSTVNAALYGLDVEMPGNRYFGQALLDSVQAGIVSESVIDSNNREVETEGSDRTEITLPSGQDELITALAEANPNIVTVIVTGAPVVIFAIIFVQLGITNKVFTFKLCG